MKRALRFCGRYTGAEVRQVLVHTNRSKSESSISAFSVK